MKKFALVLAIMMVACMFVACENNNETTSAPATESVQSTTPSESATPDQSTAPAATTKIYFTGDDLTAGEYSVATEVEGTVFTLLANDEKSIVVEATGKDNKCGSYTVDNRMKLAGKIQVGKVPEKNGFKFTTTGACTLNIYAKSASSSATDRTGTVLDATGAEVGTCEAFQTEGTTIEVKSIAIPAAGTYYFGSTVNGINIFVLELVY